MNTQPEQTPVDAQMAQFIFRAGHGLLSELSALRWGLEVLASEKVGPLNGEQQEMIHTMHLASRNIATTLKSMFLLGQIEQNLYASKNTSVALRSFITDIHTQQDEEIAYSIDTSDTSYVVTDPILLAQLFVHIFAFCSAIGKEHASMRVRIISEEGVQMQCCMHKETQASLQQYGQEDADAVVGGTPGFLLHLVHNLSKCIGCTLTTEDQESLYCMTLSFPKD